MYREHLLSLVLGGWAVSLMTLSGLAKRALEPTRLRRSCPAVG